MLYLSLVLLAVISLKPLVPGVAFGDEGLRRLTGNDTQESIVFDPRCLGRMVDPQTHRAIGSAFIAGPRKYVITAAHVSTHENYHFKGLSLKDSLPIKVQYILNDHDLSVFSIKNTPCVEPFDYGDFRRMRPGDRIFYVGWDGAVNKWRGVATKILAVGSATYGDAIVEFLEFEGFNMPGFSGAPVFDKDGRVVAIVVEARVTRGIKGGQERLISRAFSVDILKIITEHLLPPGDQ